MSKIRVEDAADIPDTVIVEDWKAVRSLQDFMVNKFPPLGVQFNVHLAGTLRNTPAEGLIGNVQGSKNFFHTSKDFSDGIMTVIYTSPDGESGS